MGVCCRTGFDCNYVILIILICICGCNSRTPPAAAGNTKLFEHGTVHTYHLTSTVTLNEPAERKEKEVGHQIQGEVSVGVIWMSAQDKNEKLLELELKRPKLLIKSRKAPTPEGFDVHSSELDKAKNFPFLIHWRNGIIIDIYLDEREEISMVNLKKGISSLLQVLDLETKETDASGECQVTYRSIDPLSFSKIKTICSTPEGFTAKRNSDTILRANVTSSRTAIYKLLEDLSVIKSVTVKEYHEVSMIIKKEVASSLNATQVLTLIGRKEKAKTLVSVSLEDALKEFSQARKLTTKKQKLSLEMFSPNCDKEDCPSLPKLLKDNRGHLSESSLGTLKSAGAFVRLLSAARTATKDDLIKAFKGNKNKEILSQLCDLAGAIQLPESHEIVMKMINFDSDDDFDKSERYLWSLASGSHPHEKVIKDIYKRSQQPHPNEKLSETLILTLASMAQRFSKIQGHETNSLLQEITQSLLGELEICKDEACKIKYLRALKNLKCPKTIPVLIKHALNGKTKTSVEAMKGLRSFEPKHWTADVIDTAQRIYFQAGKKYDSSSRTLALDILLESNSRRREILQEVLLSLLWNDSAYEVKQYLVQRVKQISEKDKDFSKTSKEIFDEFRSLFNNYNVQAQRGLTTAFARNFANNEHRNGSLIAVLEISKGLLKRGIVDVVIESPEGKTSLFTMGLFAGGLSSFVSSDEDKEESNEISSEEDVATAGMELSVLGSQIRPFVFFSGQGELMGHVWSGTASEKTPAYQALILVIDHLEKIPLQNGFVAHVEVLGGVSFDLSGQIQISLWNRNAHSLVEKNAGISLQGQIRIDSSFVRSKMEFTVASELKLNLQSDLNFYSGTSLCMQLSQPQVLIKHNVHKIERIPGGKHRLRKSKYSQLKIPGRTYALNRKNNEMCNVIFS